MFNKQDEVHKKLDALVERVSVLQTENRRLGETLRASALENDMLKKELVKKEADLDALIYKIEQISL